MRSKLNRREFLAGAALANPAPPASSLLLLTADEAARLKPPEGLKALREACIKQGPWSVTFHRPGPLSEAGPHDFFSEGPYWWPDPKNPGGPYIRKDGQVNPDRFTANDNDMGAMSECVMTLGLAAHFLKDREAAARAWRVLDVWFLATDTRMNPNLEYGQAIRGVTPGRGIGIIDSRPLIWCVQGVALLDASYPDAERSGGVKKWFAQYLEWLTKSKKGQEERDNGNNHATWWAAQAAAYAIYSGNAEAERDVYEVYRRKLVPGQLKPDGSAPKEEARTRSLSYSIMNLDGFTILCRLAANRGVDLWSFRTPEGAGVLRSAEYILPYLSDPQSWKKQQITPVGRNRGYFAGLAGLGVNRPRWVELQRQLGMPNNAWGVLLGMLLA